MALRRDAGFALAGLIVISSCVGGDLDTERGKASVSGAAGRDAASDGPSAGSGGDTDGQAGAAGESGDAAPDICVPATVFPLEVDVSDAPAPTNGRVAIDGNTLVVDDDVYARTNGQWKLEATIHGAMDISGDTILSLYAGAGKTIARAYVRNGGAWSKQADLTPSAELGTYDLEGAIDGDTVIFASDAPPYVFSRSGTVWTEEGRLFASDGGSGLYGRGVALHGETAAVSAPGQDAVYVFTRAGGTWTEQAKLQPCDGGENKSFGMSLAVYDDILVVGSPGDTAADAGSAYVFERNDTVWTNVAVLRPDDAGSSFGSAVSTYADLVLVGAPDSHPIIPNGPIASGVAHTFLQQGDQWAHAEFPGIAAGTLEQRLGWSLDATSGAVALGGEYGTAPVLEFSRSTGLACSSAIPCGSGQCAEGVCCDSACAGPCESCLGAWKTTGGLDGTCGQAKAGKLCGATCVSSVSQPGDMCDSNGTCQPQAPIACAAGYLCTDGVCQTSCKSDSQCDTGAGYQCTSGACALPLGASCTGDVLCASGFCRDGVCCDSDCGECQACTAAKKGAGKDGVCAAYAAGTDPDDDCQPDKDYPKSCLGDGECDGAGHCRMHALAGTPCESQSCQNTELSTFACDGDGFCKPHVESCFPYACASVDACATSCLSNEDCVEGTACWSGECRVAAPTCTADGKNLVYPDGGSEACEPYVCQGEACRTSCSTTTDCATGYVCDPGKGAGTCVDPNSQDRRTSSCAYRAAPGPDEHRWFAACLGALLLWMRSRRRRGRSSQRARTSSCPG